MACDRLTPTAKCCRRFAAPPRPKKKSTKGTQGKRVIHEGPRRGWRRLERGLPRIAKRRKNFHEKAKRYPRRATKNGEGPRRGWRRPERACQGSPSGERISTKRQKDFHEGPRRMTTGHEGVGGGPRGVCQGSPSGERISTKRQKDFHEGPRRKTFREKDIHHGAGRRYRFVPPITPPLRGSRRDQGAARGRAGGGPPPPHNLQGLLAWIDRI